MALTACHNDSKTTTPDPEPTPVVPTELDISGGAVKGSLALATVNVYAASDTEKTTVLATAQTDASGDYTVKVVDATGAAITGAFIVEVVADYHRRNCVSLLKHSSKKANGVKYVSV